MEVPKRFPILSPMMSRTQVHLHHQKGASYAFAITGDRRHHPSERDEQALPTISQVPSRPGLPAILRAATLHVGLPTDHSYSPSEHGDLAVPRGTPGLSDVATNQKTYIERG